MREKGVRHRWGAEGVSRDPHTKGPNSQRSILTGVRMGTWSGDLRFVRHISLPILNYENQAGTDRSKGRRADEVEKYYNILKKKDVNDSKPNQRSQ